MACLISTAMILVMVGGDIGDNLDAGLLCGGLHLGDVIWVDRGSLVGSDVDKQVRVVVVAHGYGDDPHSGWERGGEGANEPEGPRAD